MWTFYNSSGEAMYIDGGLSNVIEDTTPQLGGNLDMVANLLVGNGGSTGIAISANGEVTMAAQPSVLAYNSATDSNVTGNAATATVDFDTEVFDQNGDFASDTFTAPVTGRYSIVSHVRVSGVTTSATRVEVRIVTSNAAYENLHGVLRSDAGTVAETVSVLADMDASDTVTITLGADGESSDVWDIVGDGSRSTWFSAMLVA
jgi:hypothetical protein